MTIDRLTAVVSFGFLGARLVSYLNSLRVNQCDQQARQ